MKIDEAKAECQRWLDYLDREKERSVAMQGLASERRQGLIDEAEGRRRLRALDNGVKVYDGAKLAEAVKLLLRSVEQMY